MLSKLIEILQNVKNLEEILQDMLESEHQLREELQAVNEELQSTGEELRLQMKGLKNKLIWNWKPRWN